MAAPRIYVAADLHLGHAKVLHVRPQFGFSTAEEHDAAVIDSFNSIVKPKDTLILLGDVAFGDAAVTKLKQLNGYKRLVLGNHDNRSMVLYMEVFAEICSSLKHRDAVLTHIPVHPQQLEKRFRINIHGHLHGQSISDDSRYRCVSLEHTGLKPVLLSDLMY